MTIPKRKLGSTGLEVSEVALGCWQIGNNTQWGNMGDQEAFDIVHKALDHGCNLFDTAPNYALSRSETLLGKALKGKRDDVVIISKFGHLPDESVSYTADTFWQSLHDSLKRLQTDYLDAILVHSPPFEVLNGRHEVWEAMEKAQDQGKIRFYGASVDYTHEIEEVLSTTGSTVLEILFNMLHQESRYAFDLIKQRDIGVLTKVPLDSGWLGGRYDQSSRFNDIRARWSEAEIQQRAKAVADLRSLLPDDGKALSEQAIAYILSYCAVSSVIPGARSIEQLEANFAAAGNVLDSEVVKSVERYWEETTDKGKALFPW